jgi:hypothetical protein
MARAQDDGRGAQSHGLSVAHSGQSQTAKAAQRARRHLRQQSKKDRAAAPADTLKRLRIDWKATVLIGDVSRGGRTRGDHHACDHDWGVHEPSIPCGIVDAESGPLPMTFGSSYKTSDCIVETLEAWWAALDETEQVAMTRRHINMDNGPESSGRRTQLLHRMVALGDASGKPIQLLYSPPLP